MRLNRGSTGQRSWRTLSGSSCQGSHTGTIHRYWGAHWHHPQVLGEH
jgi:hypothetical protein